MPFKRMEQVLLQPYDWEQKDVDGKLEIKAWALDEHSKPHLVRINDFPIYCQVELPASVGGNYFDWSDVRIAQFYKYLKFRLNENAPTHYAHSLRNDLYYYQGGSGKSYVMLMFKSLKAMDHCKGILSKPINFNTFKNKYGIMQATVCETEISAIRKMLTARDSNYSGWHMFTGYHPLPYDGINRGDFPPDHTFEDDDKITKDVMGNVVHHQDGETYRQISTLPLEQEWIVSYTTIRKATKEESFGKSTHPKLLGFDIEQYSDNPNIFPNMWTLEHVAFMISCVVQVAGDKSTRKRYGIVCGNVDKIPKAKLENVEVIMATDEIDMIHNHFANLIIEHDPDVMTGYNIIDFDYPCLDARLQLFLKKWPVMGRLRGVESYLSSFTWESGGYGFNNINNLIIPGRISIDMYPIIRRKYKLTKYSLDFVGKEFLGRQKHDVSYREMFLAYERSDKTTEDYQEALKNCDIIEEHAHNFADYCKTRMSIANGAIEVVVEEMSKKESYEKWRAKNPNAKDNVNNPTLGPIYNRFGKINWCSEEYWDILKDTAYQAIRAANLKDFRPEWRAMSDSILAKYQAGKYILTRVLIYCLIDSDLCIDLFDKLETWLGLIQMSAVVGVTVTELFTRGQQIACLSQLYDLAAKKGIVLNKRESPNIFFNGGFVFDVEPGLYDGVAVIDFNSLYPSIMMAYNICYTTLLRPEHFHKVLPDAQYYALPPKMREGYLKESDVFTIKVPRPDSQKDNNYDLEQPEEERNGNDNQDTYDDESEAEEQRRVRDAIRSSLKDCVSDENNYYFRFVKPHIRLGLLPQIVRYLVTERKAVRKEQAKYEKGSFEWTNYEMLQLAFKVSANSIFGFTGAGKNGKRSLIEGAMCITAIGRQLITYVNEYVEKTYGAHVVYGDSVTGRTPILIRQGEKTSYVNIEDVPKLTDWQQHPFDETEDKEYALPAVGLEVWSDKGFTPIKHVMRHGTKKQIYYIATNTGYVEVTEDHSLLNEKGEKVSPKDLKVGDKLLSADLPKVDKDTFRPSDEDPYHISIAKFALQIKNSGNHNIEMKIDASQSDNTRFSFHLDLDKKNLESRSDVITHIGTIEDPSLNSGYVYDLETGNHHFAAGVGRIVVHNTDSSMIDMHVKDKRDYVKVGDLIAAEISSKLPDDLRLELEKVMKMICVCKKKYVGYTYEKDGSYKIDKDTGKPALLIRGIVLARRDNNKWLRDVYRELIYMALDENPLEDVFAYLTGKVEELMSGNIDYNDLVTVRSVGAHYKNPNYFMKLFADNLARSGKPVKPGERIGYLITKAKTPEEEQYLGNRMTLPEKYENSQFSDEPLEIDYLYYLERQFTTNIDLLFAAGFKKQLSKFSEIRFRPNKRCKYTLLGTPMKMFGRMIRVGIPIDRVQQSIVSIAAGRNNEALITDQFESYGYCRPEDGNPNARRDLDQMVESPNKYDIYTGEIIIDEIEIFIPTPSFTPLTTPMNSPVIVVEDSHPVHIQGGLTSPAFYPSAPPTINLHRRSHSAGFSLPPQSATQQPYQNPSIRILPSPAPSPVVILNDDPIIINQPIITPNHVIIT